MSKPYDFVPFLEAKINKESKFENSGKIDLNIKALNPVHISSGELNENNGNLYKAYIRINNVPVIPGTSFKGCIRTISEAVSYSCYSKGKNIDENKIPVWKRTCKNEKCIICDMYGSMGKKSKLSFTDFKMIKGRLEIIQIPALYGPKPDGELYLENGKYKGYKFYKHGINSIAEKGKIAYEFISVDSEFEGSVYFNNLSDNELRLLCFSLGLNHEIQPKIGYGKPAYYGSIEITGEDKWINKADEYKKNADTEIIRNIDKLTSILSYKNAAKVSDWKASDRGGEGRVY